MGQSAWNEQLGNFNVIEFKSLYVYADKDLYASLHPPLIPISIKELDIILMTQLWFMADVIADDNAQSR